MRRSISVLNSRVCSSNAGFTMPYALVFLQLAVGCASGSDTGEPSGDGGGTSGPTDDTGTATDDTGTATDDTGTATDDTGTATDDTGTATDDTGEPAVTDSDGDGVPAEDDCDDNDASLGAVAEDGDCDGALTADDCDDSDSSLNMDDADADGYATCDGDCDDADAAFYPGAVDGLLADHDCDGTIDSNSLSLADYRFVGEDSGTVSGSNADSAGYSVSGAGDVDGDGLGDLLVGAFGNNAGGTDAGKVYLVLGASLGSNAEMDLSLADYHFVGEDTFDNAGISVSGAGDVDGDGLDDLLIGAWGAGDDSYSGKAYLVLGASLGSTSEINLSDADYAFVGENQADYAGISVSGAGDVDGDGLADIMVGAPNDGGSGASMNGMAYVILGASLGTMTEIGLADADYKFVGEDTMDMAGNSVSGAGDVDGDGLDDLLIGAASGNKAYLVLGASLGSTEPGSTEGFNLSDADYSFVGENIGDDLGRSVSGAGDVDGDGLDDILMGAPYNSDGGDAAGKTYLFLGASLGSKDLGSKDEIDSSLANYVFAGEKTVDVVGYTVSGAGDVDGDGLDDILLGTPMSSVGGAYAGKSHLVLGTSLGSTGEIDISAADYSFLAENSNDFAGISVSGAGDVDGDGRDDILVGAYGNDDGGTGAGKAYLILSRL